MTRRRSRPLTSEERRLWAEVSRSVVPLGPDKILPAEPEDPAPAPPPPENVEQPRPGPRQTGPKRATAKPAMLPLAPVERVTMRALARGRRSVDAKLDLHGMRQAEAHAALIGFLRRSQGAGHALVLVVTGKGGAEPGSGAWGMGDERGILRRMVPHWLRLPDLRGVVLGFDEAVRHQGGEGALYVRVRRPRTRT